MKLELIKMLLVFFVFYILSALGAAAFLFYFRVSEVHLTFLPRVAPNVTVMAARPKNDDDNDQHGTKKAA